jgi:tetratricopeptide (TPR) repeat protein
MLSNLWKSLIFTVIVSCICFAERPEEKFEQGNKYYMEHNYFNAIKVYEDILSSGYESSELYYNLGNSYFREGKLGKSILNYERGLVLAPGDEDLKHNLAFARSRTVDRVEALPKFFIFEWWESTLSLFSASGWGIAGYILFILILISAGIYLFARTRELQKKAFYSGIVTFILLILTISLLVVKLNKELNIEDGVVIKSRVTLKLSPDEKGADALTIHEGLKVRVEDRVGSWIKVRLPDGKQGWLEDNTLEII